MNTSTDSNLVRVLYRKRTYSEIFPIDYWECSPDVWFFSLDGDKRLAEDKRDQNFIYESFRQLNYILTTGILDLTTGVITEVKEDKWKSMY